MALRNFFNTEFHITLEAGEQDLQLQLALRINELIQEDFPALINILYRIDVDELKLKQALEKFPNEDAASIIAKLIIDRQLQKIKLGNTFTKNVDSDSEETW